MIKAKAILKKIISDGFVTILSKSGAHNISIHNLDKISPPILSDLDENNNPTLTALESVEVDFFADDAKVGGIIKSVINGVNKGLFSKNKIHLTPFLGKGAKRMGRWQEYISVQLVPHPIVPPI